jgi:hypothetical protein
MGKTRYICATCANGFTTLAAAKRHLKNVEKGLGMIVTEPEHRIGVSTGRFTAALPGKRPTYKKEAPDLMAVAGEEFHRAYWRRFGELECESAFKDGAKRKELQVLIQAHLMQQMLKLFSK